MEPRTSRGDEQRGPPSSSETNALTYLPMNQPTSQTATSPPERTAAMNLELGILLALACAFVANLGFFYKYRGANAVREGRGAPSAALSVRALFSSSWFALGMIVATASWGTARGRAGAGADVGDPGRAGGRDGVHRGDGRSAVRLRSRPPSVDRPVADGGRAGAAGGDAAGDARRALAVLPGGDDLLRGRPVRARRAVDHGPANGRPGRAPRRDAGRRGGNPVRRLGHRDQGAHGHHRRARRDRRCC